MFLCVSVFASFAAVLRLASLVLLVAFAVFGVIVHSQLGALLSHVVYFGTSLAWYSLVDLLVFVFDVIALSWFLLSLSPREPIYVVCGLFVPGPQRYGPCIGGLPGCIFVHAV